MEEYSPDRKIESTGFLGYSQDDLVQLQNYQKKRRISSPRAAPETETDFEFFQPRLKEEQKSTQLINHQNLPLFDWELPEEQWIPASKVRQCWKDQKEFSIFLWKNHCRKCGRVFCSNCIRTRTFDIDGSRVIDPKVIKQREQELGQKLRVTKICQDCDETFSVFEDRIELMNRRVNVNTTDISQDQSQTERQQSLDSFNTDQTQRKASLRKSQKLLGVTTESPKPHLSNDIKKAKFQKSERSSMRKLSDDNRRSSVAYKDFIDILAQEEASQKVAVQDDQKLKEFSRRHISKVVAQQLARESLDLTKWHSLIYGFVKKAVEQIKPSSQLLGDSMNINDYVKIKIIEWSDQSKSSYINGVVMTKNLADRRMQKTHANPNILLVKNTLEIGQTDLQSEIDQEEHLIKILSKKLEQLNPQIVIVEQEVTYKVLCMLRDERKISLITNMDEQKLNRIARLTQTVTANGVTVIDKRFVLGKCSLFQITNQTKLAKEQGIVLGQESAQNMRGKVEDQFLMTLDGCNPALGCTILISGPQSEVQELKRLKKSMRKMLLFARNIYLERFFLQMLQPQIEEPLPLPQTAVKDEFTQYINIFQQTDKHTPFLISEAVEERPFLQYLETNVVLQLEHRDQDIVVERDVYSKMDKICGHHQKQRVIFYKQACGDTTLVQFLTKLADQSFNHCGQCEKPMIQHQMELYHGNGCLSITPIKLSDSKLSQKDKLTFSLVCKLCGVKNKTKVVSSLVQEYSTTRLFEHFFYSELKPVQSICGCNKDAIIKERFKYMFSLGCSGVAIQFDYQKKDIYKIQLVQMKKTNSDLYQQQICKELQKSLSLQIKQANDQLKEKISGVQANLDLAISLKQPKQDQIFEQMNLKLGQVQQSLSKLEETLTQMVEAGLSHLDSLTCEVLQAYFIKRKLFINLFTYQRALAEVAKVAAVFIVLQKSRFQLLSEQMRESVLTLSEDDRDSITPTSMLREATLRDDQMSDFRDLTLKVSCESYGKEIQTSPKLNRNLTEKSYQPITAGCFVEDFCSQERLKKLSLKKKNFQNRLTQFQHTICPVSLRPALLCQNAAVVMQIYMDFSNEISDLNDQIYQAPMIQEPPLFISQELNPLHNSVAPLREQDYFALGPKESSFVGPKKNTLAHGEQQQRSRLKLADPFMTLPLGCNNVFIQINENDVGSIIAFALNSNVYMEALARLDYLGLDQSKSQGQLKSNEVEQMLLLGKEDVFNYSEINKKALEHEMLQQTKIDFQVKFSTYSKDCSIRIRDNRQEFSLNHSSMHFKTGLSQKRQDLFDLQQLVLPQISKNYLKNQACSDVILDLDSAYSEVQQHYFSREITQKFKELSNQPVMERYQSQHHQVNDSQRAEFRPPFSGASAASGGGDIDLMTEDMISLQHRQSIHRTQQQQTEENENQTSIRMSKFINFTKNRSQTTKRVGGVEPDFQESAIEGLFQVESPQKQINQEQVKSLTGLAEQLELPQVDFELKILYPKRFQALRRFYCGTHVDFLTSILKTEGWQTTGGRTNSQFYKSHDQKYVFKEVKKSEFKMFKEFGPTYFDYMAKAFFHNYPCCLAKILGAYALTVKQKGKEISKRYILVQENLNLGISSQDEPHILRFDLKGSELNRLVPNSEELLVNPQKQVLMDSNFLLLNNGRPILLHHKLASLLHICINNDTLCLQKYNIVDYSLLTIINQKEKKIRFGIIDYLQMYTLEKYFETQLKKAINLGANPTIIEPKAYRMRFTVFTRLYLQGIDQQSSKKREIKSIEDLRKKKKEQDDEPPECKMQFE